MSSSIAKGEGAIYDELAVPVVGYLEDGTLVFVSALARTMLAIPETQTLEEVASRLAPIRAAVNQPFGREIKIQSEEGRLLNLLCFGKQTQSINYIQLYDLSLYEPLFRLIEQSRKNRALVVFASSMFGRSMFYDASSQDSISAYQALEADFFRLLPATDENLVETDLLTGLSRAVDIVDPLILPSTKILLEVRTPFLVALSVPNFIRLVSHLLLEATDFTGAYGVCRVSAELGEDQQLQVSIIAERMCELSGLASPLEVYLYSRFLPQSTTSEACRLFSENMTIANHLAKQCGVDLHSDQPSPAKLELKALFRLKT